jgi:serine/threonine protein kinase
MTPERYEHLAQVFRESLELEPSQRDSFLDKACFGDERLRQEVKALLASHEKSGMLIDTPGLEVAAMMLADDKIHRDVGSKISHYEVISLIGVGGMGEVYLATDIKLNRKVALKILPSEFTSDPDRLRRFEQEAKAASALNHPNIITIYETGEADGVHFIASEFIDGQTLRQWMADMRMELREHVDVAIQIANALVEAHAEGIIHRDIKPENVMARPNGLVKILDFGLAKLTEHRIAIANPGTPAKLIVKTEPGVVMGTYTYMSPEQLRGLEVDARTDIFSLGVVLYEMIAGTAPFPGASTADVITAILGKEPLPLKQFIPEVPESLEWITAKMLVKDREERYQTAKELLKDLKRLKQQLDFEAEQTRLVEPAVNVSATIVGQENQENKSVDESTALVKKRFIDRIVLGDETKSPKLRTLSVIIVLMIMFSSVVFVLLDKLHLIKPRPGQAATTDAPIPLISSVSPPGPMATIGDQGVVVYGNNFDAGLSVKVTFPNQESGTLTGNQIQNLTSISFVMLIDFNGNPGDYKIQVINPNGHISEPFALTAQHITQVPEIKSMLPPSPSVTTGEQSLSVYGFNFQDGLKVEVTFPDGRSVTLSGRQIPNRTPTFFRMLAYFAVPGKYKIQVVNPNGRRSDPFTFQVHTAS